MKERIFNMLPAECPWRDTLHWYKSTDSTNTRAKALAKAGAPHGTPVLAGTLSAWRGRIVRSFQSPAGACVYLSVILRPGCTPAELMHLTCAAGVAMCEAVEAAAGITADLKWINDLVWQRKKLGGILTELAIDPTNGLVEYAVVGIGINCLQKSTDFPPEIADIATSLSLAAGYRIDPAALAAQMILALSRMVPLLLPQKQEIMSTYRSRCITLGQPVKVLRGEAGVPAQAVDMDDDGGLIVAFADGHTETVNSGEVSVRGFYGYV